MNWVASFLRIMYIMLNKRFEVMPGPRCVMLDLRVRPQRDRNVQTRPVAGVVRRLYLQPFVSDESLPRNHPSHPPALPHGLPSLFCYSSSAAASSIRTSLITDFVVRPSLKRCRPLPAHARPGCFGATTHHSDKKNPQPRLGVFLVWPCSNGCRGAAGESGVAAPPFQPGLPSVTTDTRRQRQRWFRKRSRQPRP